MHLSQQIFHKLLSLEAFVEGKHPIVKCSETERELIMSIRRGPLEVIKNYVLIVLCHSIVFMTKIICRSS